MEVDHGQDGVDPVCEGSDDGMGVGGSVDCAVGEALPVDDDTLRVLQRIAALKEDDEEIAETVADGNEHDGVDCVDHPSLDEDAEEKQAEGDLETGRGGNVGHQAGEDDLWVGVSDRTFVREE